MSGLVLTNNARSSLAAAISTGDGTITLAAGDGAKFPVFNTAGQWHPVTVLHSDGSFEIMKVTGRTNDVLTVTRAQDGTTAQAFSIGDSVELRLTGGAMKDLVDGVASLQSGKANLNGDSSQNFSLNNGTFSGVIRSAATTSTAGQNGDVFAVRSGGTTGYVGLNADGSRYVGFDGTNYQMGGANLVINGNTAWHAGNFNPANYAALNGNSGQDFNAKTLTATGTAWDNANGSNLIVANSNTVGAGVTIRPTASASYAKGWTIYAGAGAADIGDGSIGFWNHTAAAWKLKLDQSGNLSAAGNIFNAGNQVWHAGNFNPANYLGVSANAVSASQLVGQGNVTAEASAVAGPTGLTLRGVYSNGYPTTYGNLLHMDANGGQGQLLLGWSGASTAGNGISADNYIRSMRDGKQAWSPWAKIWTDQNLTNLSQLTNGPGYITSGGAPVQSVAGRTGAVTLSTSDISGLSTSYLGISAKAADSTKWNGANKTVSTAAPSGGADGDIWFQYS